MNQYCVDEQVNEKHLKVVKGVDYVCLQLIAIHLKSRTSQSLFALLSSQFVHFCTNLYMY